VSKREITVHCIAQTRTNRPELQSWLHAVGAHEFAEELPLTGADLFRTDDSLYTTEEDWRAQPTDADLLVGVCGKRCYASFEVGMNPNVSKIREDWTAYIDNVLKSGHGSVIEHATWTWAIEGCTRVLTAEANRHRAGVAISEASLRYIRFGEEGIPYWEPLSIRPKGDERDLKRERTRAIFHGVFDYVCSQYRQLEHIWRDELEGDFAEKKRLTSMFRRIVPMGVSVGEVLTLNARALRHVMTMRCDPSAEEEIAYAFGMIAREMFESEPRLFGDFAEDEHGFWRPKYRKV
jgi:thymidylate synthase (FAD)